jgi:uncharacterized membrane protein (UPF0127 family)
VIVLTTVLAGAGPATAAICGYPVAGELVLQRGPRRLGRVAVALAVLPDQHRRGLMHCAQLPEGSGLLFVYARARQRSFWMKNTAIALDVVFLDADWRVVNVAAGIPFSTRPMTAAAPVRYVLEVARGSIPGLAPGDRAVFTPLARDSF